MPVAVNFRVRNEGDTASRSVTQITVDYADEPSLPQYFKWRDVVWRKVAATLNYKPYDGLPIVDLDGQDVDKIVEV